MDAGTCGLPGLRPCPETGIDWGDVVASDPCDGAPLIQIKPPVCTVAAPLPSSPLAPDVAALCALYRGRMIGDWACVPEAVTRPGHPPPDVPNAPVDAPASALLLAALLVTLALRGRKRA